MDIEWDPAKAESNLRKHGVNFSDAEAVLFDAVAMTIEDRNAEREERFVTLGRDSIGRVLVVCYTYRGENIRMISARPANKRERMTYEEELRL